MNDDELFEDAINGLEVDLGAKGGAASGPGEDSIEPIPGGPPTLGALLTDIEAHVCRFVSFSCRHQSVAIALWIAHVYTIAAAPAAAYLRIKSATQESGKTTLLEVMEQLLGDRCISAVSISPSVVYRLRDKVGPVALLLDEADNTIRGRQDDKARDLLAILNSGYKRGAKVHRSHGKDHDPRAFNAFGPAAIAGIGNLSSTTESRCIPITLTRKRRGTLERFISFQVTRDAHELADRLTAWASGELMDGLRLAVPDLPVDLRDRQAETWWALFSIADKAGNGWGSLSRSAALALHTEQADESNLDSGVLLLSHIRLVFARQADIDDISSVGVIRELVENEEGPWGKWWGAELNRELSPRSGPVELARMLRPFGIRPRVLRMREGSSRRGYRRRDFEEVWARYLPTLDVSPVTPVTPATPLASHVAPVTPTAGPAPASVSEDCDGPLPTASLDEREGSSASRAEWESEARQLVIESLGANVDPRLLVQDLRRRGISWWGIAQKLNDGDIPPPVGKASWDPAVAAKMWAGGWS